MHGIIVQFDMREHFLSSQAMHALTSAAGKRNDSKPAMTSEYTGVNKKGKKDKRQKQQRQKTHRTRPQWRIKSISQIVFTSVSQSVRHIHSHLWYSLGEGITSLIYWCGYTHSLQTTDWLDHSFSEWTLLSDLSSSEVRNDLIVSGHGLVQCRPCRAVSLRF